MTTNRITFFRVFRFPPSCYFDCCCWNSYLIDNFGEKGGLLQRAVMLLPFVPLGFFFQPEKRQKSCSTHEFEANLQMALLSLLEEHFHFFLAMETFGLFWVLHFLSPTKFKIFLFPHLFLTDAFLLHVMRRETRCDIFFEYRAVATVTLASRAALPRRHKFLSRAIDWGVKVTFEWAKVNYVACCASFFHCCRSGNCSLTCQILAD